MQTKKAKRATYSVGAVALPVGTAAFTHFIDKINSGQGDYPSNKYEICVAFKEGTDFTEVKKAIAAVIEAEFGKGTTFSDLDYAPLKDGSVMDCEKYPIFKNAVFVQPKRAEDKGPIPCFAKHKVDGKVPAIEPNEIYPGAQVKLFVSIGAGTINKNKQCWFTIEAIQFVGDGERLSGFSPEQLVLATSEELADDEIDAVDLESMVEPVVAAAAVKKSAGSKPKGKSLLDAI